MPESLQQMMEGEVIRYASGRGPGHAYETWRVFLVKVLWLRNGNIFLAVDFKRSDGVHDYQYSLLADDAPAKRRALYPSFLRRPPKVKTAADKLQEFLSSSGVTLAT